MPKYIPNRERENSWPSQRELTIGAIIGVILFIIVVAVGAMFIVGTLALFGVGI